MTETKKTTKEDKKSEKVTEKKPEKIAKPSKVYSVVDIWTRTGKSGNNRTDALLEAIVDKIGLN